MTNKEMAELMRSFGRVAGEAGVASHSDAYNREADRLDPPKPAYRVSDQGYVFQERNRHAYCVQEVVDIMNRLDPPPPRYVAADGGYIKTCGGTVLTKKAVVAHLNDFDPEGKA